MAKTQDYARRLNRVGHSRLVESGKFRIAAGFFSGAVAFAGANLLLATHLSPESYGSLALIIAIIAVGTPVAPLGLAVMVAAGRISMSSGTLRAGALTSSLVSLGAGGLAATMYGLPAAALVMIIFTIASGGLVRLAAAKLQRDERFLGATLLSESTNYSLLVGTSAMILAGSTYHLWPAAFMAATQAALCWIIWRRLLNTGKSADETAINAGSFPEMLLLTSSGFATLLLMQIERLAIPLFIDMEALATFAVLALFTIAPFRPLEVGVYRTLLARLGRVNDRSEQRNLLSQEAAHAAMLSLALGALAIAITPRLLSFLFAGKYQVELSAVIAAVAAGQLRVARGVVAAAIAALGDRRTLVLWSAASWLSVGAVLLGGAVGVLWGLAGFLWGVVAGALANLALTVPLVLRLSLPNQDRKPSLLPLHIDE